MVTGRIGPTRRGQQAVVALLLALLGLSTSTAVAGPTGDEDDDGVIRIMPFGDSITSCCHACAVQEALLPPDMKRHAEPVQPFEGYMRPLWHRLSAYSRDAKQQQRQQPLRFDYIGRMSDCLFPRKNMTRATTSDWPVRYEAYYGYPTKRFIREGVASKAMQYAVLQAPGHLPRITLFHVGTNDLIAPRTRNKVGAAVTNAGRLIENLAFGSAASHTRLLPLEEDPQRPAAASTTTEESDEPPLAQATMDERTTTCRAVLAPFRRAVTLCLPVPIQFGLVYTGSVGLSYHQRARRWHRSVALNLGYTLLFQRLTGRRWNVTSAPPAVVAQKPRIAPLMVHRSRWAALRRRCSCHLDAVMGSRDSSRCWQRSLNRSEWRISNDDAGDGEAVKGAPPTVDSGVDVILVDMYSDFSPSDDLHGDGLHPNARGEAKIAQRYFEAVVSVLHRWHQPSSRAVTGAVDAELDPLNFSEQQPSAANDGPTQEGRMLAVSDETDPVIVLPCAVSACVLALLIWRHYRRRYCPG